ncbi:EAL domain-containing protein [Romeria aff. gracilis LEGE 07310]|uniref:EAL domain-containing protein n=1 Tax=Vasconcelosia minhoensis LEGE 07310 TaxID=915328 RepID=A0A8J7DB82_9CYAN|nr:EAL domain-containing protein [Romeria gracilis]MBE9077362.1 EAL domain-containing protein [Romeria aff. gracilis LEGE 07310]
MSAWSRIANFLPRTAAGQQRGQQANPTADPAMSSLDWASCRSQAAQFQLLRTLVLRIGAAADLGTALGNVIEAVSQAQGWQYGEAWMPVQNQGILTLMTALSNLTGPASAHFDSAQFGERSQQLTLPLNVGIPGRVWASQQPEWQEDVSAVSESLSRRRQLAIDCGVRAALGVPLVDGDRTLAVLVFFSTAAMPEDRQAIETITAISPQLGQLIQQKQAQVSLRQSEERFEAFMNNSPTIAFMKDEAGRYVYANQTWKSQFLLEPKELLHKTDFELLPLEIAQQIYENDRTVLAQDHPQQLIESVPMPDSTMHDWLTVKFPFTDQQGQRFIGGVTFDITQRKQLEQALMREKELAQVTLRCIGEAVITTDAQGHIQYLNPVAEKLTGWSQVAAQKRRITDVLHILHETSRAPVANPVLRSLQTGQTAALDPETVLISRDHQELAIQDSTALIKAEDGEILGAVMVFYDASQTRHLSRRLSWQTSHDGLTGLINRQEFEARLEQAVLGAQHQRQNHTLCYLDLDNFKIVNDTCGRIAGDQLLQDVATLLLAQIRSSDILARLGGDEFGLLLRHCSPEQAAQIAQNLKSKLQAHRFTWLERTFAASVSIGMTAVTAEAENAASLLSDADAACFTAKQKGRDRIHLHCSQDSDLCQHRGEVRWAARIVEALEADQFCLYYQPIVAVTPAVAGGEHYEVLLRLRDPSGQIILPSEFIPAAERYHLMHRIDRWVIQTLFATQRDHYQSVWAASQTQPSSYLYAINLSGASINDEFMGFLTEQFTEHQIPPGLICFEITETAAISNLSQAVQLIDNLRALGCRFALDDFGSGMSSLAYLKTLPIDYLKIDGSFIRQIVDSPIDAAMVQAIQQIGQEMGIQTIAEFVENEAIFDKLKAIGIDYVQGYGMGHPQIL